ncbi:MAG: hypothetical protein QM640_13545 [Niabella sp.]
MTWKTFTAACAVISAALVSVPQNIIGCGGSIDPYDYYLSFFNQYAAAQIQYKPFFYTNEQFLFDYEEPVSTEAAIVKEWVDFTNHTATEKDALAFIMKFPAKDISQLYYHIEKNNPATIADSISKNSMSTFFLQGKDLEALGYILYAKKVEPYVVQTDYWEPERRDSLSMDKLLKNGLQLYNAAKTDLFKLKYAYQVIRLAHYNHHYQDAVKYYDELAAANTTNSVLQPLCLALKAGALFRTGRQKEAAYLFSKAFNQHHVNKISNYYGFDWSVTNSEDKAAYLSLCKNNEEKAGMLSLFALKNPDLDLQELKEIYSLNPANDLLPTLVIREINKYEEDFLTPLIGKEYNTGILGISYYYQYAPKETDSILQAQKPGLWALVDFLNSISRDKKIKDPALMQLAAGYGAYMLRDFAKANNYLALAKKMRMTAALQDQWMLTNLLVTISSQDKIDAPFEARILPSLEWLYKKATAHRNKENANEFYYGNEEAAQWAKFYRNLTVDILSKRYKAQGDLNKALLALGAVESLDVAYYNTAVDFLRSAFSGKQTEALYNFLAAKRFTPYERFLIQGNKFKIEEVADFAGTAYLRDYNYDKAIEWFQKVPGQNAVIEKDPFIDILFDREERLPNDQVTTSKPAYAKEMKRLEELAAHDKVNAAQHFYKLALGCYNVTYYGYAWNLVEYFRSGVDGYYIPENAMPFEKEYYGAYRAKEYFKKAMDAGRDKEFKAKCLFMMARCEQKQIQKPQYGAFGYNNYDLYDQKTKEYYLLFASNKYFPQLRSDFKDTKFYKEALTRCSYLEDFTGK